MFNWVTGGLGALFGFAGEAAGQVAGWAWEKVTLGIYTWLANGLALLIEWVWGILDSSTTPRVTAPWFQTELAGPIGALALAVTIAMMLASATQAALAGRPEQIGDAVKEGAKAIVAAALTVTVIDVLIGIVDEASAMVWASGRSDLVTLLETMSQVAAAGGPLASTFIGPLCLLFGFIGLIGLVITLMMRSALIYVAAALAPLAWSSSVLPMFRGSSRKLVHLLVALIVSKLAIVITLVVAVKLVGNTGGGDPDTAVAANDGAAAVGTLMSGFICFLIASVTPFVLYKLMPTVEGAMVGSGVAGGWGRSVTNAAHTAMMVKSLGASAGASAATRGVAGQAGVAGSSTAGPSPLAGMAGSGGFGGGMRGGRSGAAGASAAGPPSGASAGEGPATEPSKSHSGGSAGGQGPSQRRERPGNRPPAAAAPSSHRGDEEEKS